MFQLVAKCIDLLRSPVKYKGNISGAQDFSAQLRGSQHRELMQCQPIGAQAVLAEEANEPKGLRPRDTANWVWLGIEHGGGKQALVNISTYQGSILEFRCFEPQPNHGGPLCTAPPLNSGTSHNTPPYIQCPPLQCHSRGYTCKNQR